MISQIENRAKLLMTQVLKTWDPPLQGRGSDASIARHP